MDLTMKEVNAWELVREMYRAYDNSNSNSNSKCKW